MKLKGKTWFLEQIGLVENIKINNLRFFKKKDWSSQIQKNASEV